ncbi:MAG: EAL domain-containing protein [Burkholderiaceae bacterium]
MAKILVVDDVPVNREFIATLLGYQNHLVLEAGDGAEALAVVSRSQPDLVICDILMPTMDGFEFVRLLREDPRMAATRVIYYTAHYHEREARNLAAASGVLQVLTKPCGAEEILAAVAQALDEPQSPQPVPEVRQFEETHLRLMTDKLSGTIDDLRIANERLAALTELNLKLASEKDISELLASVCQGARNLIGSQYAVIGVYAKDGSTIESSTSGIDVHASARLERLELDRGILGEVVRTHQARRIVQPNADLGMIGLPEACPPLHTALAVPVASLSKVYGWVCLVNKLGAEEFSSEDERALSILAAQTGRIYENGSLYREVREQAEQLRQEVDEREKTLEKLSASEAALHRAQVVAKLTHVISTSDGSFESWPETLPQMIGLQPSRMVANTREWLALVHPEDRTILRKKAIEASISEARTELEYRMRRMDGTYIHIRQVMEPIRELTRKSRGLRWFNTLQDITDRKLAEDALRESDRRFSEMLENVELLSLMLDREGRITYCNEYLLRLTDWQSDEVQGRDWNEFVAPNPSTSDAARDNVDQRPATTFGPHASISPHHESEILTRTGERRLVRWNSTVLRGASGEITGTASIGEDITDRREAEHRIKRLNRVYAVLSGINTLIVRARDRDELFEEACHIALKHGQFKMAWIGIVAADAMRIEPVASAGLDDEFLSLIRRQFTMKSDGPRSNTMAARVIRENRPITSNDIRGDPNVLFVKERLERGIRSMAVLPLVVSDVVVGVFALYADEPGFFDAEEMKLLTELAGDIGFALDHIEKAELLNYLAYYDEVTGLPNRTLFLEQVSQQLRTHESPHHTMALALVDIDRFRIVNDTLGRKKGDELLKLVAQKIQGMHVGFGSIARVGVNCFGVTLLNPRDVSSVALTLEELLRTCFGASFELADSDVRIAAKVGIAVHPSDGEDAETLLRNAELAVKRAKASGEWILFYAPGMNSRVAETLDRESRLRTAIERQEFVLFYQPKFNLATRRLTGAEALMRWNDPKSGLVRPTHFIPLLEETGLIHDAGRWALRQAISDFLRWRDLGLDPVRIAVNVSPLQLRQRAFVSEIEQATNIDPRAAPGLELELTESMVMEDVQDKVASLEAIRALGVRLAIDDFGTGFSSLNYLSKLPVDTLKIDQSFIAEMTAAPKGLALVSTIIELARSMHLNVVAEGVETEDQSRLLSLLRCDEVQGNLLSEPLPAAEFEARILRGPPLSGALFGEKPRAP